MFIDRLYSCLFTLINSGTAALWIFFFGLFKIYILISLYYIILIILVWFCTNLIFPVRLLYFSLIAVAAVTPKFPSGDC